MRTVAIPRTDLRPSAICLGTADVGLKNTEAQAWEVLSAFVERGGTFIDTARVYSDWAPGEAHRSERIVGDWLAGTGIRGKLIIATKCGFRMDPERKLKVFLRPEHIREDLEGSLRSLRIDRIDLFYVHTDDPEVPVGEILDTLDDCEARGLIRFYACSNWSLGRMRAAREYAASKGSRGFVAHQMKWNAGLYSTGRPQSAMSRAMYRFMEESSMVAVAWSSQANGFFTKLARAGGMTDDKLAKSPYHTPRNLELYALLQGISARHGVSMTGVVLQYLLRQPLPTIPIVGAYTLANLADSLAAAEEALPPEAFREIDQTVGMDAGESG